MIGFLPQILGENISGFSQILILNYFSELTKFYRNSFRNFQIFIKDSSTDFFWNSEFISEIIHGVSSRIRTGIPSNPIRVSFTRNSFRNLGIVGPVLIHLCFQIFLHEFPLRSLLRIYSENRPEIILGDFYWNSFQNISSNSTKGFRRSFYRCSSMNSFRKHFSNFFKNSIEFLFRRILL